MPNKAFLEITNACNLSCDFCHGTKREIKYITLHEFEKALKNLNNWADYLYFHLMGEPLLHKELPEFLELAHNYGYRVILTTNGTLIKKRCDALLSARSLHKISISLHCAEANEQGFPLDKYLDSCFDFCRKAAKRNIISVMRLWNIGGKESLNGYILEKMRAFFGSEWKEIYSGYKIEDYVFLEWGERFDWPDKALQPISNNHTCYGLRDQIGILSDGSVVPCCLDAEGCIRLGNIFEEGIDEILNSERALNLKRSFEARNIKEPLCIRCGYASKLRK